MIVHKSAPWSLVVHCRTALEAVLPRGVNFEPSLGTASQDVLLQSFLLLAQLARSLVEFSYLVRRRAGRLLRHVDQLIAVRVGITEQARLTARGLHQDVGVGRG